MSNYPNRSGLTESQIKRYIKYVGDDILLIHLLNIFNEPKNLKLAYINGLKSMIDNYSK
jgi:hypothetical protein